MSNNIKYESKQALIEAFAGQALIAYSKETDTEITLTNRLNSSLRNTPYMEFLYPLKDEPNYTSYVYNSSFVTDQCNVISGGQLIVPDEVSVNDKCRLMMDLNFICYPTQEQIDYPKYQRYPFKTNPEIELTVQYLAKINSTATKAYEENAVERWNTYLYYPGTLVYLLINANPFKIYVMQAFKTQIKEDLLSERLVYLNDWITLPEGWTFAYMQLGPETFLSIPSNGKALVVADSISNPYMYIPPTAAPWLYKKYGH